MNHSSSAWWDLGYYGIFACVFLEQVGVPIPAFPALLAAGALAASGELSLPVCLAVAVSAALLADVIWFGIGAVRGGAVLNLMCKVAWRPDSCVSKTKAAFSTYGTKTLLFAKFIPGLSVLAPPLAGIVRVPFVQFLVYDAIGSVIWALTPLLAGLFVRAGLAAWWTRVHLLADLPWICGGLIVGVLIWRYVRRRRFLRQLEEGMRDAVTSDELQQRLEQGEDLVVLDVRHEIAARARPVTLPRARWIPHNILAERASELPPGKPIVVYCDCPRDQGAVTMSQWLNTHGAARARPLRGGLDEWIAHGLPTSEWTNGSPAVAVV